MPFTFSHPALVLPVYAVFRRWVSLTGLVAGSVAPDFEKFMRMSANDPYSHTWRSIFYFSLPVGLLIAFVFHLLVRDALVDNLPGFINRRVRRFKQLDWVGYFRKNYIIVIVSILLGAASHLFWDSFTHKGGRGAAWLPFMLSYVHISGEKYSAFYIMQVLSSLAGAYIVLYATLTLPPAPPLPGRGSVFPYWLAVSAIAVTVTGLQLWLGDYIKRDLIYIYIAAVLVGLIAAPLVLKRLRP